MANELSKTANILSLKNELKKTRYFYDETTGRPTFICEAARDTGHGGPCLVTQFDYATAGAVVAQGTLEFVGEWDSSWDITEATPS